MRKRNGLLFAAMGLLLLPTLAAAQLGMDPKPMSPKSVAPEAIRWQPTLDAAKALAGRTNRLVLVHFWGEWCGACRTMEQQVFSQPGVANVVEANFVAVKINAAHFPTTCQQYGVSALPTEIIMTPQGQLIDKFQGAPTASQYVARLNRAASVANRAMAGSYGQAPGGPTRSAIPFEPASATSGGASRPPDTAASWSRQGLSGYPPSHQHVSGDRRPPAPAVPAAPQYGNPASPGGSPSHHGLPPYGMSGVPSTTAPPTTASLTTASLTTAPPTTSPPMTSPPTTPPTIHVQPPAMGTDPVSPAGTAARSSSPTGMPAPPLGRPPSHQAESGNPPLGLDGYCAVQLFDDMINTDILPQRRKWTLGDRRWGVVHHGRTYLFSGPDQARRFYTEPDRYAPVLSGDDVVLAADFHQTVPGRRQHGVIFGGKIYLFANEANLAKFEANPAYYAGLALQAMRATAGQRPPLR